MVTKFRSTVGRSRLGASIQGSTRSSTQSARASMQAVIKEYQRFVDHVEGEMPDILEEALGEAFELSQKYVPQDTGVLKDSGYLQQTTFRGRPTVEIGYGKGGKPNYAAVVHENLDWRHKAPTKAKFLEDALKETSGKVQAKLVSLIKLAGGTA